MIPLRGKLLLLFSIVLLIFTSVPDVSGQWVRTKGPKGGVVRAITGFGNKMFSGAGGSGLFQTSDNGNDWIPDDSGLTSPYVQAFAYSGSNLFVGTGKGVFVSTDMGTNWSNSDTTFLPNVFALAVSDSTLFAGLNSGGIDAMFRSTNNGVSWSSSGTTVMEDFADAFAVRGSSIFVGSKGSDGSGSLLVSNDDGLKWTQVASMGTLQVSALAFDDTSLLVGTSDAGLYLSMDSGSNYAQVLGDLQFTSILVSGKYVFAASNWRGVFLSTNNGTTWAEFNDGLMDSAIYSLAVNDSFLFAGTDTTGVWRRPLSDLAQSSVSQSSASNSTTVFRAFPNPASGTLQITGSQSGEVHLFDLMGRERLNATLNATGATLDVSHLEDGLYFLRSGDQSAKVEIAR
jgi:ligand-binding sensor domain-containing protein